MKLPPPDCPEDVLARPVRCVEQAQRVTVGACLLKSLLLIVRHH
jgi:hypothetical protein